MELEEWCKEKGQMAEASKEGLGSKTAVAPMMKMIVHPYYYICNTGFVQLYRVSQEECTRLRESVPYVKVYRYNPKHLYPKLNGYGDNGQRKVRPSCGSTYCTCSADALRVYQNAQSAKLNQYFNTAGYSCAM